MMRIYLIGFMGAGKSTLGQRTALTLNVPFFDTDAVIETQAGMMIPEIFERHGELYFRQLEADVLRQTTFYTKSVNATGGGLPMFEDNMAWMNHHGITLYLQWEDDTIIRHLLHQRTSRPLLAGYSESEASRAIQDLLEERKPVYTQSAMTLEMKGDEREDAQLLLKACEYIW